MINATNKALIVALTKKYYISGAATFKVIAWDSI